VYLVYDFNTNNNKLNHSFRNRLGRGDLQLNFILSFAQNLSCLYILKVFVLLTSSTESGRLFQIWVTVLAQTPLFRFGVELWNTFHNNSTFWHSAIKDLSFNLVTNYITELINCNKLIKPKLHYFDLLLICSTTNPHFDTQPLELSFSLVLITS